ncbi:MAG TPA: glycosyltransferase, partial [Chloroflexota bacterium]|jgi:glycosyltransferase involved in cell wall biosynthesis|nr:glycosyltransferase [Chloroflexota bacterium]
LLATLGDRLQSLYPTIQIRLIGTGPLASSLRRHRTLQLDGNLVHVHVPQALRASDVFVFPSHYESFGIAPLEAQAVGLPAVVSDLAALREATGDAAIYLPPTDLSAWFETLRTLIADAKRRESLARAGRAHAATMTWEVAAARLEPFIKLAQDQPQRRIGDRLTLPP